MRAAPRNSLPTEARIKEDFKGAMVGEFDDFKPTGMYAKGYAKLPDMLEKLKERKEEFHERRRIPDHEDGRVGGGVGSLQSGQGQPQQKGGHRREASEQHVRGIVHGVHAQEAGPGWSAI